jgi:hypothetical protein
MKISKILELIDLEEELDGEMPDEIWSQIQILKDDKEAMTRFLRQTVIITKRNIRNRILEAAKNTSLL